MIPKIDIGDKIGSTCLVGMQVQNGKFVRVDPAEPGTFDCDNNKPPLDAHDRPGEGIQGLVQVERSERTRLVTQRWSNLLVWAATIVFDRRP